MMNRFLGSQNAMTCLSDVFKSLEYKACIPFLFLNELDSRGWVEMFTTIISIDWLKCLIQDRTMGDGNE